MNVSHEILVKSFETAVDGWMLLDDEGQVLEINKAALKLFDYEKSEMQGHNVSIIIPNKLVADRPQLLGRFFIIKKRYFIGEGQEVEGLKKNGDIFPFRLAVGSFELDNQRFFTAIFHDISHRRSVEQRMQEYTEDLKEKVKESQQLHVAIAKNFPNGCINVLDSSFNYIFTEGQLSHIKGKKASEMIGTPYLNTFPKSKRKELETELLRAAEGMEVNLAVGIEREHFRIRATPLFDEQNEVRHILVVENNITEQKVAEKELAKALQTEKEVNELKSRFVSMASHEFRTPLSTISSSAILVGKYSNNNLLEKIPKHLDRIQSNVTNLTHILNDFLNVEKLEKGMVRFHPEPINLEHLIHEVIEETTPLLNGKQEFELSSELDNEVVHSDPYLIRNIMINLISNAIKYSIDERNIEIKLFPEGDLRCIAVTDHGIGISEEDKSHMFSRFFRARNATNIKGTGLGLTIVKRYADLMNAVITFESKLDLGTTFYLKFKPSKA